MVQNCPRDVLQMINLKEKVKTPMGMSNRTVEDSLLHSAYIFSFPLKKPVKL